MNTAYRYENQEYFFRVDHERRLQHIKNAKSEALQGVNKIRQSASSLSQHNASLLLQDLVKLEALVEHLYANEN